MISALRRHGRVAAAAAALCAIGAGGAALAINVTPVVVDLTSSGRRTSAIVTVQNTFAESVPVEALAHPVKVVDGELVEDESVEAEELLVFPGQTAIAGNQSQAFRVQWVGDPAPSASQHFYVTIGQLPVTLPGNQNAIQVLHRFKILVNVGVPDGKPLLKLVKAEVRADEKGKPQPVLTIANAGNTFGYAGKYRMTLVQTAADGREIFRQTFTPEVIQRRMGLGLVPSGASRVLPMNVELPELGGSLSVEMAATAED